MGNEICYNNFDKKENGNSKKYTFLYERLLFCTTQRRKKFFHTASREPNDNVGVVLR